MPRTAACARITTLSKPRSRFEGGRIGQIVPSPSPAIANFRRQFPTGLPDQSALIQVIVLRTSAGARGVSSCTPFAAYRIIPHSLFWLSSGLEYGLERVLSRPQSVFRTAITPTITVRSTSPMSSPVCSVTRFAARGGIALRSLPTPLPACAADGSQYGFRGSRLYAHDHEPPAAPGRWPASRPGAVLHSIRSPEGFAEMSLRRRHQ
jgi:hypothetical protein